MSEKHVYRFGKDENGDNVTEVAGATVDEAKWITGGKGANLAEMANIGLPVPPGFSITCQTCVAYSSAGNVWPDGVLDEIDVYRKDLEKRMGKKLGDKDDPLLVSVRSGAPFSMPGMMDTVLNLGLNDDSVQGLIKKTGNPRFGYDSYRRFVQMFSDVVMGVDGQLFEDAINAKKAERGVKLDTELDADDLKDLVATFKQIFSDNVDPEKYPEVVVDGKPVFPHDPYLQLRLAEQAVFGSWNTPRAILYRKQNKIPDDLGTAVNVQCMVFGNMGDTSATGVAFTRNPADGTNERYGDFLVNAQGEDVVAGIRNTEPISDLPKTPGLEEAGKELYHVFEILEDHYADMMDLEFTIQEGKLWMLQTRVGKRTALSALKVAIQMYEEGRISRETAVMRVAPEQLDQLLHPQFDPKAKYEVLAKGLNASPGAATGAVVFSSADAEAFKEAGKPSILVRWETTPDDLKGMVAAEGILTSHGGKTSHAAVIARGMGAPCVCGVEALHIDAPNKECKVAGTDVVLHEGDIISIDTGATKDGWVGDNAWTFYVGSVSDEARALCECTRDCLKAGIEAAVPGNHLGDIGAAVQELAEGNGYGVVRDYVGHGVGRVMHEEPSVPNYGRRHHGVKLQVGMVIAIEPMITAGSWSTYVLPNRWTVVTDDGSLAAHYENTIAITKDGPVILTEDDGGPWCSMEGGV